MATTKILTDQPVARRRTVQAVLTDAFVTMAQPPIFSVPLTDEDIATADPADADRELRPGETFIATSIQIANITGTAATVDVEIVGEGGTTTSIAPGLTVPANEVLTLLPGLSIFKRDLANHSDDGDILRAKASTTGAITLTATVVDREALEHAPDTEGV